MQSINTNEYTAKETKEEKPFKSDNINQNLNNNGKKNIIQILLLVAICILIIVGVAFIIILLLKNRSKKEEDENLSESSDLKHDEFGNIYASYFVKKNEEFMVFNPEKIDLSSNDYYIKLENQTRLRLMTNIELNEGKMISSFEGILTLTIGIKKKLNNLKELFSGCNKLKIVDLSELNTFNINNYDSLFKGCSSLEKINFPKNNSENILSMNNMFDGCINLKEVSLTSFKISEATSMSNIFNGCLNLQNIDISNFNFISPDFFNGINYGANLLINNFLSESLKYVFNLLQTEINFYINEFSQQNLCHVGETSKCSKCGEILKFLCMECYDGYYLYIDKLLSGSCKSCQIENCKKCNNILGEILCSSCNEGYYLNENKCIPNNQIMKKECEKGENEKCLSCNNEEGKNDQCLACNIGYYLSINATNKTFCSKCEIDNCVNCYENSNSNDILCDKCENGYKLKNNKCIKKVPDCAIGQGSLCALCRTEDERLDECLTCNNGYFITNDEIKNKSICSKCLIPFCEKCEIKNGKNICNQCKDGYFLQTEYKQNTLCLSCNIGEDDKCKTCGINIGTCGSCNDGYILVKNGSCLKIDNSIMVTYKTNKIGASIRLFEYKFYDYYYTINTNNIAFYENNIEIYPSFEKGLVCEDCGAWAEYFSYKFNYIGEHKIKIVFKSKLNTMKDFFHGCYNITSIKFSPSFDTSGVNNMESLFGFCENLIDLDISMFNTSNVVEMNFMFYGLYKIKKLDLSNFDTRKTVHMQLIFDYLYNLEYLDISSWNTSITTYCYGFFGREESEMSQNVTIIISNKLKYGKDQIYPSWKVINIDEF